MSGGDRLLYCLLPSGKGAVAEKRTAVIEMQEFLQVNPLSLPSVPLTEKHNLPNSPAVYFALGEAGDILYIGRSNKLATRWNAHHRYNELNNIGNVRIAWLHCEDESLLPEIEAALIQYFLPRLNFKPNLERQPNQKKENTEKLIEIIKKARGSMSQRGFGKLVGVSATAVQLWEKGETIPESDNLAKIAALAGYKIDDLVACLEGKVVSETSDLDWILAKIKVMPLSQVAMISRAVADRISEEAESLGA